MASNDAIRGKKKGAHLRGSRGKGLMNNVKGSGFLDPECSLQWRLAVLNTGTSARPLWCAGLMK